MQRPSPTTSRQKRKIPYPFEECDVETVVVEEEEEEGGGKVVNMNTKVACPLFKIPHNRCAWVGRLGNVKTHMILQHNNLLWYGSTFKCTSLHTIASAIIFNSELFLYYKFITEYGHWYTVVQQVGTTNRKYRYKIKLCSEDETVPDRIYIFRVTKITLGFEVLFDARRCFTSIDDYLEPFVTENGIDMTVEITENRSRK